MGFLSQADVAGAVFFRAVKPKTSNHCCDDIAFLKSRPAFSCWFRYLFEVCDNTAACQAHHLAWSRAGQVLQSNCSKGLLVHTENLQPHPIIQSSSWGRYAWNSVWWNTNDTKVETADASFIAWLLLNCHCETYLGSWGSSNVEGIASFLGGQRGQQCSASGFLRNAPSTPFHA